ncbi:MAG: hypothetical protein ACU826_12290 [Gammaproteobacteria bacterium]
MGFNINENRVLLARFRKFLFLGAVLILQLCIAACSPGPLDAKAFERARIRTIGIVLGGGSRALLAYRGPVFVEPVYAPLPPTLDAAFNALALGRLKTELENKGYRTLHLKTSPIEWNLYGNIGDTRRSYHNLLDKYGISPRLVRVDAILIAEYMLQNKPIWAPAEEIDRLTTASFEVNYAKAKIWLFDVRTGQRIYFSINQKGHDQVFTRVAPSAALREVLKLRELPRAGTSQMD